MKRVVSLVVFSIFLSVIMSRLVASDRGAALLARLEALRERDPAPPEPTVPAVAVEGAVA